MIRAKTIRLRPRPTARTSRYEVQEMLVDQPPRHGWETRVQRRREVECWRQPDAHRFALCGRDVIEDARDDDARLGRPGASEPRRLMSSPILQQDSIQCHADSHGECERTVLLEADVQRHHVSPPGQDTVQRRTNTGAGPETEAGTGTGTGTGKLIGEVPASAPVPGSAPAQGAEASTSAGAATGAGAGAGAGA